MMLKKSLSPTEMSLEGLKETHEELHLNYKQGTGDWNEADFVNYHILVLESLRRKGQLHENDDNLDELSVNAKKKATDAALSLVEGQFFKVNVDYFKKWSPNVAYAVGFIMADATIMVIPDQYQYRLSFELNEKDKDLLEWFKKQLQYEGNIRKSASKPSLLLQINNKIMVENLLGLGLKPDKTAFPKVPNEYLHHLFRGYFDANGSMWTVGNSLMLRIAGRKPIINRWNKEIAGVLGEDERGVVESAGTNILPFSGGDSIKIAEWMYKDAGFFLGRKKKHYDGVAERAKEASYASLEISLMEGVQKEDYGQPGSSGKELGGEITLDWVLEKFKPLKLGAPHVYLTGGIVNRKKTNGDIDILVKTSQRDHMNLPLQFRIIRLFPEEFRKRIHFIFDDTSKNIGHGPFTSHIPLYDLDLRVYDEFNRVEMAQKEPNRFPVKKTKDFISLYLVGAERRPIADLVEGVMLNAVTTKKRDDWLNNFGGKVVMDNGIFGGTVFTIDELVSRTHDVGPDIVIGPDVLYDDDIHTKSIDRQTRFMKKTLPKETMVQLVPQGNTTQDYEWCIKQIVDLNPDYIGLGRMSMKLAGYPLRGHHQRAYALHRFEDIGLLDEIRDNDIKIHALGISKPSEFKYLNYFGVSSADSMSYIYSSIYNQIVYPHDPFEGQTRVNKDGTIDRKQTDTDEVFRDKQKFFESYPAAGHLNDRQLWIMQNVWLVCREEVATRNHIEEIVQSVDFEQEKDDTPVLEKPQSTMPGQKKKVEENG